MAIWKNKKYPETTLELSVEIWQIIEWLGSKKGRKNKNFKRRKIKRNEEKNCNQ